MTHVRLQKENHCSEKWTFAEKDGTHGNRSRFRPVSIADLTPNLKRLCAPLNLTPLAPLIRGEGRREIEPVLSVGP